MSRIGKQPIAIPSSVTVIMEDGHISLKGPKGTCDVLYRAPVVVVHQDAALMVSVPHPQEKHERALWGTIASIARNAMKGVTEGYLAQLEIIGTGYKAAVQKNTLTLSIGFSHPVTYVVPSALEVGVEKNTITVKGADKQLVGETAAQLRRIKKPDPYKGTGIRIVGEIIKLKPGKQAKSTGT